MLELSEYREAIKLDEPWPVPGNDPRSNRELFEIALGGFTDEQKKMTDRQLFDELEAQLIERDAAPIPEKYGRAVNQLLYRKIALLGRTEAKHLKRISDLMPESDYSVAERTVLWRGDIRELVVDAVVEGASPDLQGFRETGRPSADQSIHSQAGPWLRNDGAKIHELQGSDEVPGGAQKSPALTACPRITSSTPFRPRSTSCANPPKKSALSSALATSPLWKLPLSRAILSRSHSAHWEPDAAVSTARPLPASR